jgi:hypothetical protein
MADLGERQIRRVLGGCNGSKVTACVFEMLTLAGIAGGEGCQGVQLIKSIVGKNTPWRPARDIRE